MTELDFVDNQLSEFMFGNSFSLFLIDMCRYHQVYYMFNTCTVAISPENLYQYENIQQFISLLWTHFPNREDRISAFYTYREKYITYKYLINTSFMVTTEYFPYSYSYTNIVESLMLNCLID